MTASALELLALRRGDETRSETALLLLRIGWWAALIAFGTGTIDLARQLARVQESLGWINAHVAAGLATLFIYSRLAFRRKLDSVQRRRLHLAGSLLIILSGLIGGHMVYELNFGQ